MTNDMTTKRESSNTRCGYVAIVGRPNVGKSTLLNHILMQKVSITSSKPQTTRHQLLGIKTESGVQILYVDTPGIHTEEKKAINRYMNRNAKSVLRDVDVIVFVTDRTEWSKDDKLVAELVKLSPGRLIVAINKVDLLKDKTRLLPHLQKLQEIFPDTDLVPISAESGDNTKRLEQLIAGYLPEGPFYFEEDQVTDRTERFMVSEIIREKMMRQLGEELPYALTIQIEQFKDEGKLVRIEAVVFVEREGQKIILIGKGGSRLKRIGTDARKDIERLLGRKVMLNVWAKVKSGWSDSDRAIKSLGYDDV